MLNHVKIIKVKLKNQAIKVTQNREPKVGYLPKVHPSPFFNCRLTSQRVRWTTSIKKHSLYSFEWTGEKYLPLFP